MMVLRQPEPPRSELHAVCPGLIDFWNSGYARFRHRFDGIHREERFEGSSPNLNTTEHGIARRYFEHR